MQPRAKTNLKLPTASQRSSAKAPAPAPRSRGRGEPPKALLAAGAGLIAVGFVAMLYTAFQGPAPSAAAGPEPVRIPAGELEAKPVPRTEVATAGTARSTPSTKVAVVRIPREKAAEAFAPFHGENLVFPDRGSVTFGGAGTYLVLMTVAPSSSLLASWDDAGIVLRETYGPQSMEVFVPSKESFERMLAFDVDSALYMGASSALAPARP